MSISIISKIALATLTTVWDVEVDPDPDADMEDSTDAKSEADTAEAEPLDRNLAEVVVEACTEVGDLRARTAKDVEVEAFTDVLGFAEKEVEVDALMRVAPRSRMPLA